MQPPGAQAAAGLHLRWASVRHPLDVRVGREGAEGRSAWGWQGRRMWPGLSLNPDSPGKPSGLFSLFPQQVRRPGCRRTEGTPLPGTGAKARDLHLNSPIDQAAIKIPRVWFLPLHVLPGPRPPSITQVFELVQSLLGHTTWLTEAKGHSNEGTVLLVGSFYRGDKTLCHRTAHLPPQTECKTVTTWLRPGPQTHNPVAWTRPDGNLGRPAVGAGTGGGGERPWAERRQCLLVIIHFTRGFVPKDGLQTPMRPVGWCDLSSQANK